MFRKKKKEKIENIVKSEEANEKKIREKPKKVKEKPKKWDCEKDGHKYEIVKKIYYVDDVHAEISVPTGQGQFFLECEKCKKRRIFSGSFGMFDNLWEYKQITTELFNKLNKEVREFLSERQKEYKEALEKKEKSKVDKKINNNKKGKKK